VIFFSAGIKESIKMFSGSSVALVTPFNNGRIDLKKLAWLVEFHIKNGTNVLFPCGTTGESATLTIKENEEVIEAVVKVTGKRIKVVAGTGSNCTEEALEMTSFAKKIGADGVLIVVPYYNKPTQEGMYLHFKKIAEEVNIPIIIYNIESRTGVNMLPSTVTRLAGIKNIAGIKEASGDLDQISAIVSACGDDFEVLSGDDALTLPIMSVGGKGVISVVANIVPNDVKAMVDAFNRRDIEGARKIHHKLAPLVKAMFYETNPIPVKTAMGLMGMISDEMRLPMCPISEDNLKKLKKELKNYGLI
jgi:4-hydroxy-tetrahydrodipicolinate synthase